MQLQICQIWTGFRYWLSSMQVFKIMYWYFFNNIYFASFVGKF